MAETNRNRVEYLPVGSVVTIKGNIRKTIIIGRGLVTMPGTDMMYFDYGGCLYPEGLQSDTIMYFNHRDITEVIFRGYDDEDNKKMVESLNIWLDQSGMTQAEPSELSRILKEQKNKVR